MATFVLVHGGFAGGWIWRKVRSILRGADHEVYTPTLTGLGERSHLANPDIDLMVHVQDVLGTIRYEDLKQVILVGASYGGVVITGVAEEVPDRLKYMIFVDALIPEDGQSVVDMVGPDWANTCSVQAKIQGEGWRVPCFATGPPEKNDWRLTDQSLKTFQQPLSVKNPKAAVIPKMYIYCRGEKAQLPEPVVGSILRMSQKARSAGWLYRSLNTGHNPQDTMPEPLANLFLEVI